MRRPPRNLSAFEKANYDVTPDGEHFVMVRRDAVGRTPVTVVLDWLAELQQMLPN